MQEGDIVCWQHTEETLGYDDYFDGAKPNLFVIKTKPVFRSTDHVRIRIKKDNPTSIMSYPVCYWKIKKLK